jgi:hypothetical protein
MKCLRLLFGLLVVGLAITISTSAQIITTYDVPGAVGGTYPNMIVTTGEVSGSSLDADGISHAFVRAADGTITTFDVPGWGGNVGTRATSMDDSGTIAEVYSDASEHVHRASTLSQASRTLLASAGGLHYAKMRNR